MVALDHQREEDFRALLAGPGCLHYAAFNLLWLNGRDLAAVTSRRLAILRLHGRRAETWERPGATVAERYRYLYTPEELEEWVPKVLKVAQQTEAVHVLFNNCHGNYGTTNALELTVLLQNAGQGAGAPVARSSERLLGGKADGSAGPR